jgi:hypothetical protein
MKRKVTMAINEETTSTELELFKEIMAQEYGSQWLHHVDFNEEHPSILLHAFLLRNNYDTRIVGEMFKDETCLSIENARFICKLFKHNDDQRTLQAFIKERISTPVESLAKELVT